MRPLPECIFLHNYNSSDIFNSDKNGSKTHTNEMLISFNFELSLLAVQFISSGYIFQLRHVRIVQKQFNTFNKSYQNLFAAIFSSGNVSSELAVATTVVGHRSPTPPHTAQQSSSWSSLHVCTVQIPVSGHSPRDRKI